MGRLRIPVNRSAFDLEAVLDQLDYDAETIISFVKQQIAFEQYNGLLRGAQGTLMSRAGNSLDQSLLLAKLLRDAGYDARIVRGKLGDDAAAELIREMIRERAADPQLGNVDQMVGALQEFGFLATISNADKSEIIKILNKSPDIHSMPEYQDLVETAGFVAGQFPADISLCLTIHNALLCNTL